MTVSARRRGVRRCRVESYLTKKPGGVPPGLFRRSASRGVGPAEQRQRAPPASGSVIETALGVFLERDAEEEEYV